MLQTLDYVDGRPAQILWRRLLPVLTGLALAGVTTLENTTLAGSLAGRAVLTAEKHRANQERFLKLLRQHNNVGTHSVAIVVKLRDKKVTPQDAAHAAIYAARHDMDIVDFADHRRKKREQAARRTVLEALRTADYHHKTAATLLGVHRRTLERRAKRLGIAPPSRSRSAKRDGIR